MPTEFVKLSFGLPVRNGEAHVGRAIESILAQDFSDLELVISDNASTDSTAEICREIASRDPRVRFLPNASDIGVVANFNRVFELSRGEYFRWIGADDWLEPQYAAACVTALDARPDAIGVTTYQAHWDEAGERRYHEYRGARVDSPLPQRRFARMLWFLRASPLYLDPMYSLHRRSALCRTGLVRPIVFGDRILAAELSLLGPYAHVPRCLAHRYQPARSEEQVLRLLRPPGYPELDLSVRHRFRVMASVIRAAPLGPLQRLHCLGATAWYFAHTKLREVREPARQRAGRLLRASGLPIDRLRTQRAQGTTDPGRDAGSAVSGSLPAEPRDPRG